MKANYSIRLLPLGNVARNAAQTSFEVKVLCQLTLDGDLQAGELRAILDRHPVLSLPQGASLHGTVRRYSDWIAGRRTDATILGRCDVTSTEPFAERRRALADLVGVDASHHNATKLVHAKYFDTLNASDFVDVTEAMDEVRDLMLGLHGLVTQKAVQLRSTVGDSQSTAADTALAHAKWLGSCVQSAVLDLVGERAVTAETEKAHAMFASPKKVKSAVDVAVEARGRVIRRMQANGRIRESMRVISGAAALSPDDVNMLLQSTMKSELLSRLCGFVTTWTATFSTPLPTDEAIVFELPWPNVQPNPDITVDARLPTAFFCGAHAHPASYQDIGAGRYRRCGFAWLSNEDDQPTSARYRATSISAEHQFTKQVIVQSKNTLGSGAASPPDAQSFFRDQVDARGPDQLSQEASGVPDAQSGGVTISAPVDDLVTPADLKADSPDEREKKLPCLFMEDLWVGFRLDIRDAHAKTFASTHRIVQSVQLKSGTVLSGETEDYFEREQPQDPKYEFSTTDLKVYRGLSDAQSRDYLLAAGLAPEELSAPQNDFYTVSTLPTSTATALVFGGNYDYRLRLVFAGGCSIRIDEKHGGTRFEQTFPFYRCAALQAGDIWIAPSERSANGGIPETLFVSAGRPRIELALMPRHLDLESARFHGMLFRSRDEPARLKGRRIIKDFTKSFPKPPSGVDYFCDPDVYGIRVTARILNGAEPVPFVGSDTVNGANCDLVNHLVLKAVDESFGDQGEWEGFRPIWLSIVARDGEPPRLERKGSLHDCKHIELSLPGAAQAEITFLPLYAEGSEARHAANVASSSQLLSESNGTPMLVPAVAASVVRVTHAVGRCRWAPEMEPTQRSGSRLPAAGSLPLCDRTADRPKVALLTANVSVDAPSSKQAWCEANWLDILDTSAEGRPYRLKPGRSTSQGINLIFQRNSPPIPSASQLSVAMDTPDAALAAFDQQLVQSRLFLGQEQRPAGAKVDELNLPDERRRLMAVRAASSPRFIDVPGVVAAGAATSGSRTFDVPSALSMTPLRVAYAVPLKRVVRDGHLRSAAFAMRIYLHADMFESGPCERVAIGCWPEAIVGGAPLLEVPKYVTQWGEDPLARAKLSVTKRMPRASDFSLLQGAEKVNERLDQTLYPAGAIGGGDGVIYRDAVSLPAQGAAIPRLSLASFAVRFDPRQRLWYFDVSVDAEFFGWCGLALYRHQPHSLDGFELSQAAAWIYASTLYEEPFTLTRVAGDLRLVVGPVYDKSVSFALDLTEFRGGVSLDLGDKDSELVELPSRRIGGVRYFEGLVSATSRHVSLVKMRAGYSVQSRPVVEGGVQP